MTTQAIPLLTDSDLQQGLPAYAALSADMIQAAELQVLSPKIMQWDSYTWLIDLTPCLGYWQAVARRKQVSAASLITDIMARVFVKENGLFSYRAALADHPWQALLLLQQMDNRGLTGLVSKRTRFGDKLYSDFTWESYWDLLGILGDHLQASQRKRFQASLLRSQCAKMQRAVKRLGLRRPDQLKEATPLSMKRRFGPVVGETWQWSFTPPGDDLHGSDLQASFPWLRYQWEDAPAVQRHLDYPLCEWDHIKPFLEEDFGRLCSLSSWHEQERIVSLEWQLVFRDMTSLLVPIHFRHPHSLHLERTTHHQTALLQALYSFERAIPGSPLDPSQLEDDILLEPIVSWKLVITERLRFVPQCRDLFGGSHLGGGEDAEALLQLENRLPVELESYRLRSDWLPEDSFCPRSIPQGAHDLASESSLTEVAAGRPLFLYRQPRPFNKEGHSSLWQFSERTMAKWWHRPVHGTGRSELQRDYYKLIDSTKKVQWVYKDSSSNWYIHGLFA